MRDKRFYLGRTTLATLSEFRRTYAAAYASAGDAKENPGLLANALYGFTPTTRPVFWRLLDVWHRLYSAYASVMRSDVADLTSVARRLAAPSSGDDAWATSMTNDLFEPISATSASVSQFLERFMLPQLEAVLAAPEDPPSRLRANTACSRRRPV